MADTPLSRLKQVQSELHEGLSFFVHQLRRDSTSGKLTSLAAVILLAGNPPLVKTVLTYLFEASVPRYYAIYWIATFGVVIGLAFLSAWRSAASLPPAGPVINFKGLKLLAPFEGGDHDIFIKLQRDVEILDCVQAIVHPEFRFGVLRGNSGSGKTSFLRAGLCPTLVERSYVCLYVKISNADPVASIREALTKLSGEPHPPDEPLTQLISSVSAKEQSPCVLILDQFEQFFIHHTRRTDREAFVQELQRLTQSQASSIKVILGIRTDFFGQLVEILEIVGWPQRNFELQEFTPRRATQVFRVIAEEMGIEFDERFVSEMTSEELASKDDGRISPVDIQILCWMIVAQVGNEVKRFTRRSFQLIGGVEALMERYLAGRLSELGDKTSIRRQAATKVLLALIDLDRNTRTRVLTTKDLKQRLLGASLPANEVNKAINWLMRSDVRLIVRVKSIDIEGYELAHERLVPAVRKEANELLGEADRASILLDSRVNEWLGSNRSKRHLFTYAELKEITRQRALLRWGSNTELKHNLVTASWRRIRRLQVVLSCVVIVVVASSAAGIHSWQKQRASIREYEDRIDKSGQQLSWSANEALESASSQSFTSAYLQTKDEATIPLLIESFFNVMDGIGEGELAPMAVTKTASQLQPDERLELLGHLLITAQRSNDERIAHAIEGAVSNIRFERNVRDLQFLADALNIVRRMKDSSQKARALSDVAGIYARMGEKENAFQLLNEARGTLPTDGKYKVVNGDLLRDTSYIYSELGKREEAAECLEEAVKLAETTTPDPIVRRAAYSATSDTYLVVGANLLDFSMVRQASQIREKGSGRADVYFEIQVKLAEASIYSQLHETKHVHEAIDGAIALTDKLLDGTSTKAMSFRRISSVLRRLGQKTQASDLLSRATQQARAIDSTIAKANSLEAIAEEFLRAGDSSECKRLVRDEVIPIVYAIEDESERQLLIKNIVETCFKLSEFGMAESVTAKLMPTERSRTLAQALNEWALSRTVAEEDRRPPYRSWATNYLRFEIVK